MKSKSSTSSVALAASALASNEPDLFGRLPSASKTHTAKQSLKSTGPTPPYTTTLEPSRQMNLGESTSSAEGSPVSLGVSPGSSEAQKMTVTSGRSWLPLLKSYGLDGSLGRMCEALLTNRWASNAAFLTWKASDINASHLLFQLAPSMPRTDETVSGLWPTPRSFSAMAGNITEKTTRPEGFRGNLEEVVARTMWPTPTTPSGGGERSKDRAGTGNLHYMARKGKLARSLWPTPTTRDYKGGRKPETLAASGRGGTNTLNDAVTVRDQHGSLNPAWVEWLMGFPEGWTDLNPSEMPLSRQSSNSLDAQLSKQKDD